MHYFDWDDLTDRLKELLNRKHHKLGRAFHRGKWLSNKQYKITTNYVYNNDYNFRLTEIPNLTFKPLGLRK